jgi:hypothetical protein
VLLIFGNPENGKSHLAKELAKQGYHHLSVDHTYVDFFREKCPELYFPELRWFIAQHFENILDPRDYTIRFLERDYASEWHSHLLAFVARTSAEHDRLAVEGYLLKFCLDGLEAKLKPSAKVSVIKATGRTYRTIGPSLSLEEMVALELENHPAAPGASNERA